MEITDFTLKERFTFLRAYIDIIIYKRASSLIISGDSGYGKSWEVLQAVTKANTPHILIKGFATARALYDTMYYNRNKLIIFDDCDSILQDKVAINILKGGLDTYDKRVISWLSKSTDKTVPLSFDFQGQIIFISNLPLSKFDEAMKSRALTIDIFMTSEEKISKMYELVEDPNFLPQVEYIGKLMSANILSKVVERKGMNLRTLMKAALVYEHTQDTQSIKYIAQNVEM